MPQVPLHKEIMMADQAEGLRRLMKTMQPKDETCPECGSLMTETLNLGESQYHCGHCGEVVLPDKIYSGMLFKCLS